MVDNVRVIGNEVSADDNTAPILNTALHTNYPNPFNPETRISYDLRQAQDVKLEIYNVRGQLVHFGERKQDRWKTQCDLEWLGRAKPPRGQRNLLLQADRRQLC